MPPSPPAAQLWLAADIVNLPLLVVEPAPARTPLVVVTGSGAEQQVVACNESALQRGIRPGHDLNAAHALAGSLCVRAAVPQRESRWLRRAAHWAMRYTPLVSLEPPRQLLLEVRGSLALFGGAAELQQQVRAGLEQQGCRVHVALAPTPLAASWLAQAGRATIVASTAQLAGNLATLRLEELAWPPAVRNALRQLGVRTLAELVRLPRDGLARRYGVHWLQMLDQAFARAPTPRRRYVAPERYRGRRELTMEIADATRLLPVVTHLLHELEDFLQTRAAAIADCRLLLEHRGGRQTRVALGLLEPGSTVARFQPLLETELAKCRLPAPVRAVRLVSGRVLPATLRTPALGLATGQRVATPPEVLLERLQARLGEAAVAGVCLIPEHRPEAAWRRQPALRGAGRRSRGAVPTHESSPDLQPPRPLWLLGTPQPLELREERVWHEGPLTIESGPERIESGWWDGDDVARDYYVAVRRDAVRVWIYRERTPERRWWLHGIFG